MFLKLFIILFFTILLQAAPKAFISLGDELELLQKDCKVYQDSSLISEKVKKKCKEFDVKLDAAFAIGYKLDPDIDSDSLNESKLNQYLDLLHNAEADQKIIMQLVHSEISKARKQNNTDYYTQLIKAKHVKLDSTKDYKFMNSHKEIFAKNPQYAKFIYEKNLSEREAKEKEEHIKNRYYLQGLESYKAKRYENAMIYFLWAAEDNYIYAQKKLSEIYKSGKIVRKDLKKAEYWSQRYFKTFRNSCNAQQCRGLGAMYRLGNTVEKNYSIAINLYQKSCDMKNYQGCADLGQMYYSGDGVKRDHNKSAILFKKACDGKDWSACIKLGTMYKDGEGVAQDINKTYALYDAACDSGLKDACRLLLKLYHIKKAKEYEQLCNSGQGSVCVKLAMMYSDGDKVGRNKEKSMNLLQKACDLGDKKGCSRLKAELAKKERRKEENIRRAERRAEREAEQKRKNIERKKIKERREAARDPKTYGCKSFSGTIVGNLENNTYDVVIYGGKHVMLKTIYTSFTSTGRVHVWIDLYPRYQSVELKNGFTDTVQVVKECLRALEVEKVLGY